MKPMRKHRSLQGRFSCLLALLVTGLFAASLASAGADEEQAMREANFKAADVDEDGELSAEEFRAFIDANAEDGIGRAPTIKRFGAYDRALSAVDEDGNGRVSWSELMARLSNDD